LKHLVVTADDFGLSLAVNEAVEQAHHQGILSSASLMVGAPAAADAVERARRMPRLRVGLHLVLIEANPVLPAGEVADLVGADGAFRCDPAAYGARLFFSKRAQRQLAAEIEAQFAAFRATGLALDHVDAHKHFHMHPTIARELIRVARAHGVRWVRTPVEPAAIVARVARECGEGDGKPPRNTEALLAAPFARLLERRLRRAGFATPDQVFGLAWSGAMTAERLAGLISHLPDGVCEIYTHPATSDGGFAGAAPGYRYRHELAALTDPSVREALARSGARLGGFSDVAGL
jgi:hopanoid biosynthesis associated protein HpnK